MVSSSSLLLHLGLYARYYLASLPGVCVFRVLAT